MKHQIALPMVRTLDRWEHALLSFSVSCITFRLHIQSVLVCWRAALLCFPYMSLSHAHHLICNSIGHPRA